VLVPSALIQLISQLGKRWFYLSGLQGTHPGAVAGSGGRQQPTGRLQIPRKTRSDLLSKPDIVGISMLLAAFALVSSARASCHTSCSALSRSTCRAAALVCMAAHRLNPASSTRTAARPMVASWL
jgi:hypothetical protein